MPTYDFVCPSCENEEERVVAVENRNTQVCRCGAVMGRKLAAPLGRVYGKITPGGGPDRFTADVLGIPLKDLPTGLRTSREDLKRIEEAAE